MDLEIYQDYVLNQRFFGLSIVCSECRKGVRDMCMYCKNSTAVESTTTHVVNYKNCIIVIKNVPCLECEQCGEKYYTDAVAENWKHLLIWRRK